MNTSPSTTRNHRARWAAIGAAIAVSLGAGGIGLVNATSPEGASAFVPIDACRIADTRPTQLVGSKTSPFGPQETHTYQTQGAETGQCDPLPSGITGLALNVTAVGASELTHLTFWAEGPVPNVSSLNPTAGQPPTPNAVTTDVAADGSFRVFNFAGSVHLIIDVLGYYTDHHHDDRYYTKEETDDALAPRPATANGKVAYAWNDVINPVGTQQLTNSWVYNPSGEPVTVSSSAVGRYQVIFTDLNMTFGHVQVSAYGNNPNNCKVVNWGPSTVNIRCVNGTGVDVNSLFTVLLID